MKTISKNWPVIRQVIYSLTAAIFGGLTLLGVFTDAQVTEWLGHTTTVLTAIGTAVALLASLYTPNPKGAQTIGDGTETPVNYEITKTRPTTVVVGGGGSGGVSDFGQVIRNATDQVGAARAELERRLGR
ncbi:MULTISPECIES: hypothetical protein [Rhodococcus]|uniref:hypothetical protein n=1 Tax=Rhodococcus TaxID=1827 RepID=UPI00143E29D9|nr:MULTISPECIES: hypothetical protein [Rhodococcus]QIX48947.1 hypothetical protein HFP48_04835 [Rhodococcus sp. DMU1]QRI76002.1 hypothetical protein JQ505_26595 [Rhodococcus aetherivorans]QSE59413.1 hypothetical protein JYA75_27695 [Rhodococcus sp. PSBB066]QSE69262.1 hypothetical protein JYA91_27760 [Rhodococcus sp. PSBB049]